MKKIVCMLLSICICFTSFSVFISANNTPSLAFSEKSGNIPVQVEETDEYIKYYMDDPTAWDHPKTRAVVYAHIGAVYNKASRTISTWATVTAPDFLKQIRVQFSTRGMAGAQVSPWIVDESSLVTLSSMTAGYTFNNICSEASETQVVSATGYVHGVMGDGSFSLVSASLQI